MKIAQICPYDLTTHGGVSTHIANLSRELIANGHEVKVFGPAYPNKPLATPPNLSVEVCGRPAFRSEFNGARIPITLNVPAILRMLAYLEREKYDVIHVHEPMAILFSMSTTVFTALPTVGSWHCYAEHLGFTASAIYFGYKAFKRPIKRYTDSKIQKRMAVSEPARRMANTLFPGEYEVVPNGINLDFFSKPASRPTSYRQDRRHLLFVGRLDDSRKGLAQILTAYACLKWEYPDLQLTVVGSGQLGRDAWSVIGAHNIDDVNYVGAVSNDQLPAYYQHATIFCAPNTEGESFGIVLNEAMASSTPVVASDIEGFRSTVGSSDSVEFFKAGDTDDLARALRRLLDSPQRCAELVENGGRAVQRYAWPLVTQKIEAVYRAAIDKYSVQNGASKVN